MIDDNHVKILNETGDWLTKQIKELLLEVKQRKRVSKKLKNRVKEFQARLNQYQNDMKKVTDEGEEWKNEN